MCVVASACACVEMRPGRYLPDRLPTRGAPPTAHHLPAGTCEERYDENTFLRRADRLAPMRTFRMCTNVEPPVPAPPPPPPPYAKRDAVLTAPL
ncbi:hypothetical protein NQL31_005306 [Lotmaria passim]